MVVLHEEACHLEGAILHPLNVKIGFGADLVFGDAVFHRRVGIGVMGGTSVPAGDDNPFPGLFLHIVEEIDENRIDPFLAMDDGQPVASLSFAIGKGLGVLGNEREVRRTPFAPEVLPGDAGQVRLGFPGIDGAGCMLRSGKRIKAFVGVAVDRFCAQVAAADLLSLRLLDTGTGETDYC